MYFYMKFIIVLPRARSRISDDQVVVAEEDDEKKNDSKKSFIVLDPVFVSNKLLERKVK